MTTSKYHAGKHGLPLCGTRGTGSRWNVVVLSPAEWNATAKDNRCTKCSSAIAAGKK